jgi:hypothetical protein
LTTTLVFIFAFLAPSRAGAHSSTDFGRLVAAQAAADGKEEEEEEKSALVAQKEREREREGGGVAG